MTYKIIFVQFGPCANYFTGIFFNENLRDEKKRITVLNTVLSVIYAGKIFMLTHHFEPNFIFAK